MKNLKPVSSSSSFLRGNCVGKGSFGSVYLAVDKFDGGFFALKSVDLKRCLPSQMESIENEIQILRSISSPFTVKYLGDDVTEESPSTSYRNLHLEYMPAGTVADVAGEGIARSYTWCVLSALKYLHAKSIVHCDVKGRNVLVGHVPGTCKLADFGSAMEVTGEHHRDGAPLVPRGSPMWMAPEVVRREYQGPESDIWSLGCTVIEMISGKLPWKDEGVDTMRRIGFYDELPEFPAQLSELGRDFLSRCLRRERSERWNCDQLLNHPFVSDISMNTITESSPSPRCVLDWTDTEIIDEEETKELFSNPSIDVREISARGRITELASNTYLYWESDSDDWLLVRDFEWDDDDGRKDGDVEEGGRNEIEIGGTNWEYSEEESERVIWESSQRLELGGSEQINFFGFYSCCKLVLLLLFINNYSYVFFAKQ